MKFKIVYGYCPSPYLQHYFGWKLERFQIEAPINWQTADWDSTGILPIVHRLNKTYQCFVAYEEDLSTCNEKLDEDYVFERPLSFWEFEYWKYGSRLWPKSTPYNYFSLVLFYDGFLRSRLIHLTPEHPLQKYYFKIDSFTSEVIEQDFCN